VDSPRPAESPATFECRRYVELDIGYSRQIVLGEGLGLHLRADALNREKLHADPAVIDAVGRMGGHGYALTRDRFDLPTMTVAGWEDRRIPSNERIPPAGQLVWPKADDSRNDMFGGRRPPPGDRRRNGIYVDRG
jgi:hypothetical protein